MQDCTVPAEEYALLQGSAEFLSDHFFEVKKRGQALALQLAKEGTIKDSKSWEHFLIILRGGLSLWREYREMLSIQGVTCAGGGLWSTSENSYCSLVDALVLAMEINDDVLLMTLLRYDLPQVLGEWRDLVNEGKRGLVASHGAARNV